MMDKAIKNMKAGKAVEPPRITAQMLKVLQGVGSKLVTCIINPVAQDGVSTQ